MKRRKEQPSDFVLSLQSHFLHSRLHFSNRWKELSTNHLFGNTAKVTIVHSRMFLWSRTVIQLLLYIHSLLEQPNKTIFVFRYKLFLGHILVYDSRTDADRLNFICKELAIYNEPTSYLFPKWALICIGQVYDPI